MTKKDIALYSGSPLGGLLKAGRFNDVIKVIDDLWKSWDCDMQTFMDFQPKAAFPKINVIETDTNFEVEVALAGFEKDDINMELKDNCLWIMADRKEEHEEEDRSRKYLMKEISSKSFRRALNLPKKVVSDDIECFFKDGTVKCILKKEVPPEQDGTVKILIK